jgi:post-segregation antitoxin (ccd killing protein)
LFARVSTRDLEYTYKIAVAGRQRNDRGDLLKMKYPLRNIVYEKMKQDNVTTDKDLLAELQRDGEDISMRDLNKVLMQLEILGLITLRWQTKDRRRIELAKAGGSIQRVPGE